MSQRFALTYPNHFYNLLCLLLLKRCKTVQTTVAYVLLHTYSSNYLNNKQKVKYIPIPANRMLSAAITCIYSYFIESEITHID